MTSRGAGGQYEREFTKAVVGLSCDVQWLNHPGRRYCSSSTPAGDGSRTTLAFFIEREIPPRVTALCRRETLVRLLWGTYREWVRRRPYCSGWDFTGNVSWLARNTIYSEAET